MSKTLIMAVMVIFTFLVFITDMILVTRFFTLIKQRRYNDASLFGGGMPDWFPGIKNKYLKWTVNFIVLNVTVNIFGFYFPTSRISRPIRFTFDGAFWQRLLISSIVVSLILLITYIIKKMKSLHTQSQKLYYIELILIPIILILSLCFFDAAFEKFARYYFELS